MNPALDTSPGALAGPGDDLSALAWVHGELRKSLETANKLLRRYLKDTEALGGSDVDAVDPAVLRNARAQIHQGVGALELVGLPVPAKLLRACEAAVQRLAARPTLLNQAAVEAVEQASFALLDYLSRLLAGKQLSPVALFPQYRAVQQLAGADRVHPADLWLNDWAWQALPAEAGVAPRAADDQARSAMEALVLALMRQPDRHLLQHMSDLCAGLAAGVATGLATGGTTPARLAALWQLAAAFFEAQSQGLLAGDVYGKRIASRLLAQLRSTVKGQDDLSERLAQDLLFFCANARVGHRGRVAGPRLAAVRAAWGLDEAAAATPVDYETPRLGRFDPAWIAQAKKRVAGAKDAWSAVAGGELHRLGGLPELFTLVGDSLQRLFPSGDALASVLQAAAQQTAHGGAAPAAALAMEVATAMLYVDACIEDGELDHPELAGRMQRLARRIEDVRQGAEPQPLETWMEELYRRVSDRQTMGSVVAELRASLSEVEKQIDQYFRDPTQRQGLIPVPGQLQAMRGVLSVLGMDQASLAVLHMRDEVDALAQTEVDPHRAVQTGTFDHLADNLGALSFLIDMLSVQPALAKSLFQFDAATGTLSAVMGQAERPSAFAAFDDEALSSAPAPLIDQAHSLALAAAQAELPAAELAEEFERLSRQAAAADQPGLARAASTARSALHEAGDDSTLQAAVHAELAQTLAGFAPPPPEALPPAAPVPPAREAAPGQTGLEDDDEMREVFLEEAREVIAQAQGALATLAEQPDDLGEMTTVRRAFHTLKGSARMVGLKDYGEAAWACEQLYNARLAETPHVDEVLRRLSLQALDYLAGWTDGIASGQATGHHAGPVQTAADALRLEGRALAITTPGSAPAAAEEAPAPVPQALAVPLDAFAAINDTLSAFRGLGEPPETAAPLAPVPADAVASVFGALDGPFEATQTLPPAGEATLEAAPADDALQTVDFSFDLDLDAVEPAPVLVPEPEVVAADVAAEDATTGALNADVSLEVGPEVGPETSPEAGAHIGIDTALADAEPLAGDLPLHTDAAAEPPESEPVPEPEPELLAVDLDLLGDADLPPAETPETPETRSLTAAEFDELMAPLLDDPAAPAEQPAAPLEQPVDELAEEPVEVSAAEAAADQADLAALDGLPTGEVSEALLADPVSPPEPAANDAQILPTDDDEQVKVIGGLRISIPLFNIYLNEADELSRRLSTELAEWTHEHERHPVSETAVALAHSLAGSSATVGYADLSALARALEHALMRSHAEGRGRAGEPALFTDAADEVRRLLHQFAAGFLRAVEPGLMERLAEHERWLSNPVVLDGDAEATDIDLDWPGEATLAPPTLADLRSAVAEAANAQGQADAQAEADDLDAEDSIDDELFPIFEEEADELLPQLQTRLRDWAEHPASSDAPAACMRTLHTFKGGARLAGAMRLGEMAHRLEAGIEALLAPMAHGGPHAQAIDIEALLGRADAMLGAYERLRAAPAKPAQPASAPATPAVRVEQQVEQVEPAALDDGAAASGGAPEDLDLDLDLALPAAAVASEPTALLAAAEEPEEPETAPPVPAAAARLPQAEKLPVPVIAWDRFPPAAAGEAAPAQAADRPAAGNALVRVRGALLDRLVNQAGEVSITRARIDGDVKGLQVSLNELTDSLDRMRRQLRDIELQAETQMASRIEAAKAASAAFDPLEMDRFTRFQELTRFMAESVNDVATLQRSLQRTLQSTEDQLAAQARLTRELQDDLLRTRMVEFDSMADRLYRTVRQAAKDTGKQVRLDITGGAIEIDRGVLDRMAGPFEHLLRNSVAHGVEAPEARAAAGKDRTGTIAVTITQEGNEVGVEVHDDGAGLNLARIRERGLERGLVAAGQHPPDDELAQLIFAPGFSTAATVTELAGRGVGLDVVRAEVNAMGGRVQVKHQAGQGASFRLLLPLTTAVTQVVMLRCGELHVAVPSTLVEAVKRERSADVEAAYAAGHMVAAGEAVPFFWLASLLQGPLRGGTEGRSQAVVLIRSASQRVALHVDEVLGNQEVVVKNVGPQLARLPGLAGVTLLPSGAVALIYNPVALATLYGPALRDRLAVQSAQPLQPTPAAVPAVRKAPLVLVVDDSLTVRRVTQRLLVREGYRVTTAKDGMDALERLVEERPALMLSDIEMPRMDGFDLVRNVRADPRFADLTVIMITSRIAQKHREYAASLGVDHYLGKPFSEEELLGLVARYAGAEVAG